MFKDYDKYLTTSIKVYLFVLIFIFILKLVGLDYFGLDLSNSTIMKIEKFMEKSWIIRDVVYFSQLLFTEFLMLRLFCDTKDRKLNIIFLINIVPLYILEIYKIQIFGNFSIIIEILYFIILCKIYNKNVKIKRILVYNVIFIIIQALSSITRFRYSIEYVNQVIPNLLLNLDYIVILIIIYKLNFMKGDENKCYQEDHSSFSLKKLNFKNLLKRLQKNWRNFKKQDKVTKLTFIIYFILSLLWNVLSVVVILLVAMLNDTFVECIFILTSFWLSKRSFGKAFHLPSMAQCFIVSNISYYVLNRLTTPLGISIIVPILLGVGLSYVTSKLVKKTYKPLYRGMPEELFEETILKVTDKDSEKYKICHEFYIKKKSIISLSIKYNYTEAGIRKIKDRINDKIKRLN